MRTVETTATVTEDGMLVAQVPRDVSPGKHRILLMIDDQEKDQDADTPAPRPPLTFSAYPVGTTSEEVRFRREDLYGDDGR